MNLTTAFSKYPGLAQVVRHIKRIYHFDTECSAYAGQEPYGCWSTEKKSTKSWASAPAVPLPQESVFVAQVLPSTALRNHAE